MEASKHVAALRRSRAAVKARLKKRLKSEYLQRQRMTAFTRTLTRVLLDRVDDQAVEDSALTRLVRDGDVDADANE